MRNPRGWSVFLVSLLLFCVLLTAAWRWTARLGAPSERILADGLASRPARLFCSPTGEALFFAIAEPGSPPQIRALSLSSSRGNGEGASEWKWIHTLPESRDSAAQTMLSVSPDGDRIAFLLTEGRRARQIYLFDPEKDERTRLTRDSFSYGSPGWADHGSCLVATRYEAARGEDVVRLDLEGGTPVPLAEKGLYGTLASQPRGRSILTVRRASEQTWELIKLSLDGESEARLLTSNEPLGAVDWSPDGERIFFVRQPSPSLSLLEGMEEDGKGHRVLAEWEGPIVSPRWSPRGKWISFQTAGSEAQIAKVSWDGGPPIFLTSTESRSLYTNHDWSPEGHWIYCAARGSTGYWRVARIETELGPLESQARRTRERLLRLCRQLPHRLQ